MPIPSLDRVSELVAEPVRRRGFDVEDVAVVPAGAHSTVRVIVDGDGGVSLDDIAELSREISAALDADDGDDSPYTLEVTTPGIGRPLTHPRHWRRARGRKVRIDTAAGPIVGRVGESTDDTVAIVVKDKQLTVRSVPLADVTKAVVEVEFAAPSARELELCGGVAPGRPVPGAAADNGAAEENNAAEEADK